VSAEPWAYLISVEVLFELHASSIKRYGGDPAPTPREGCLEGSLGAAWNAELYTASDNIVQGLCFAGCLLYYLIMNHCFIDGNKRMAWAACMEVLRCLGLTVNTTDDAVEEFCVSIVIGLVANALDVVQWLAPKIEALPD
jgi:death-on-curing protein